MNRVNCNAIQSITAEVLKCRNRIASSFPIPSRDAGAVGNRSCWILLQIKNSFYYIKRFLAEPGHNNIWMRAVVRYVRIGQNHIPSFVKLFHKLKRNKMLGGERITKFLRYADYDLPSLEEKVQKLSSYKIDLEWRKQQSQEIVTALNSNILELNSLNSYVMTIQLKRRILADLDVKINQKVNALNENGSIME